MSFFDSLKQGKSREDIIEKFINEQTNYVIKYVSYDNSKNETWQNIETRYGIVRHPDFKVYDLFTDKFVLLIEVKSLSAEYSNEYGFIKNVSRDNNQLYVSAEKSKIEDYFIIQSHYEVECRVVFVVGKDDEEKRFYWQSLDLLGKCIIAEDKIYGKRGGVCYVWKIEDLNKGLKNLV